MSQSTSRGSKMTSRYLPNYLTLIFGITLLGIGVSLTRPYLSLFGTNVIHMTPVELGTFMCLNALGGIVASTWLGKLSDLRTPKKDIMLFSAICAGIGYASFMFLHEYWILLIISTILLGLGAATFPQMFAYARESAVLEHYGDATFAITTLRSFFSLAWVIGPLIGSWAVIALGYNGLFLSTACIFILVFFLVLFRLVRRPAMGAQKTASTSLLGNLKRMEVLTSCISFIAVYTASSMNGLYMPLFVTHTLHGPERQVGWVFSLSAGLEIPIMLILAKFVDRIGKRTLLLAGSICGIFYYGGAAFADAVWEVLLLQLLCAVFISISVSIGMSYFQDFMPDEPGSATTLYSNTNNIGSMAGSLVGGVIAQAFGFRAIFITCCILGIISYAFLLRPRQRTRTKARTKHQAES